MEMYFLKLVPVQPSSLLDIPQDEKYDVNTTGQQFILPPCFWTETHRRTDQIFIYGCIHWHVHLDKSSQFYVLDQCSFFLFSQNEQQSTLSFNYTVYTVLLLSLNRKACLQKADGWYVCCCRRAWDMTSLFDLMFTGRHASRCQHLYSCEVLADSGTSFNALKLLKPLKNALSI